ncbi:MAG: hypothetical protein HFE57_05325 [Firmicutes bacterium]|jgi:hypothetical protein|nr:hypothetical protein [Bacillota bacterium]
MKEENKKTSKIVIPQGCFCGGNCADCVYYEPRNTDSHGRGYCNHYGSHYYPSERNGCFYYKEL